MFNKSLQYSVAAQKRERYKALRAALALLVMFVLFNAIHSFLLSVWVIRSDSMQPGLRSGDRLLVASSALPFLAADMRGNGAGGIPYGRGTIVLVDKSRGEGRNPLLSLADGFLRFFTAQQAGFPGRGESLYMKRLVGLPGDEVSMINFVMRVRPAGSEFALTEFELAQRPYYPSIPQVPALWDSSLPFSGSMAGITLGPGQGFVVSDDRGSTSDSRTWGPIAAETIAGRPLLRFWPPSRIGIP